MDLHPSVLAWISTLPPEERRDYMVQLLSRSSQQRSPYGFRRQPTSDSR